MSIKTKSRLSREQIEAMVEKAFQGISLASGEDAVRELTEGMCNTAYLIRLADGRETVLKIAPPEDVEQLFYEKNMMRSEVECLRLAAEKTDVPVPEVYVYDNSKTICPVEYFFMEKLNGRSFNSMQSELTEQEKSQIFYSIGELNAKLNQIEGTYFGYPAIPALQCSSMKELYLKLIDGILADGEKKNVDIGVPYDLVKQTVAKHVDSLDAVTKPVFVHWDLWEGNVFLENKQISGIIDFERGLYAEPLMEYFFVSGENSNPDFLAGYGKSTFTESEKIRCSLYCIYLYLIMVIECPYRQYEDDGQYNWSKGALKEKLEKL